MKRSLILCLTLTGCVTQEQPAPRYSSLVMQAKTLCEVMENPRAYAGRRVVMKGNYVQDPHHRMLYDANCPNWDFRVSQSLTVKGDRAAERVVEQARKKKFIVDIPVVYVGTFTISPFIMTCSELTCFRYSLEDAQLLAAPPR
jgi:hypothetical protein